MYALAIAFLAGVWLAGTSTTLPSVVWAWGLIVVAPMAWTIKPVRIPAAIISGYLWAVLWGTLGLSNILAKELEGHHLMIEGEVATLPVYGEFGLRCEFDVRAATANDILITAPKRIRLSWRDPPKAVVPGMHFRLEVVLKRPHGLMNPGGFDYEQWLFQRGIGATGYVVAVHATGPDNAWRYPIERSRYVVQTAAMAAHQDPWMGALIALAMGEQSGITAAQWEVLALTGTTHLIAISGMHITLIAVVVFFLVRWAWAYMGNAALYWPAPKAAAFAALIFSIIYSLLAGFSIPTQRSLIMIGVATWAVLKDKYYGPGQVLATALLGVLLWDPFAILAPGFWLSFGAVAILMYGMQQRSGARGLVWQWGRAQWLVAIGLLPITLLLFQRVAPLSPLANILAVPWLSLVVTPLAMIGTFLSPIWTDGATFVLDFAVWTIDVFWPYLAWLAALDSAAWVPNVPPTWTLIPATIGLIWWLAPKGIPARWLGLMWCIPLVAIPSRPLTGGELELTLLDVGQGLAVVARTAHHTLVYDTGPRMSASFDTGGAVLVPYLRQRNVAQVDVLMVSHADNDHAGGVASVQRKFPSHAIYSSAPEKLVPISAQACGRSQAWTWDEVTFKVIHPDPDYANKSENNRSCVLLIEAPGGRILLTGDIERPAERYLINHYPDELRADVLVAPHHGSAGASSQEFVDTVRPHYVLFASGYRNRYGFPKAEPVARYQTSGAHLYASAAQGAITFILRPGSAMAAPELYREQARRFWHTEDTCC
ncbi:MAG: DNA internalization-related competence protein ComEC/Rec2 [Pseudomonadota bacterium]